MSMLWTVLVLGVLVKKSESVLYHLNETEYDRMPPLSALDEYERCLRGNSPYCLARFDLLTGEGKEEDRDLMRMIHEYSAETKTHFNYTYIERGVCIMETCKKFAAESHDFSAVVEACVNETIWEKYKIQAKISQLLYCDNPKSEMNIDWLDCTVASIFIILIISNIVGTFYDLFVHKHFKSGQNLTVANCMLSFSVIRNWKWLVSQPAEGDSRKESLNSLYGIKAFSMILTIIVHTLILFAAGFTDNPYYYEKAFGNSYYYMLLNGLTIVQIFFVISGFLLVYNIQIASESRAIEWSLLPKILLMRWLRLTPSYALTIALTATWLRHLSSGPLWNLYITQASSQCRQLWWKHLLYVQNYESGDQINICNLPGWHVAVDIQLFVVGLIMCLITSNRARYFGITLMAVIGLVSPALHVWLQGTDPTVLIVPETLRTMRSKTFQHSHIRAESNMFCYALGMLLGYKVYSWHKQGVVISKHKIFQYLNFLIVPAFCLVFSTGRIFYQPEPVPFAVGIAYATLLRVVLGIIVAYAITTFIFKAEDNVRGFFEWRGFVPLARLSYTVYLLHMNLILAVGGQKTQLQHVSILNMVVMYLGVTTLCFLIAVPYYLLVEVPMDRLLKAITGSQKHDVQEKKE